MEGGLNMYATLGKLMVALLLGLLIGIDRQLKNKPLGLKTSTVIAVASCLITIVSIESFELFTSTLSVQASAVRMDPMRLAAQIVSGIGFLGAGAILQRKNDVILGLTSAALIWAAAALGITVGVGLYIEAIFATILFIITVNILPKWIKRIGPRQLNKQNLAVELMMKPHSKMTDLLKTIEGHGRKQKNLMNFTIEELTIKDTEDKKQQISLVLSTVQREYITEIYYFFKKIEDVDRVEIEHL